MERVRRATMWLMAALLCGFFTGVVSVETYNDGGFVYRVHVFGNQITVIDEPAASESAE